MLWRRLWKGTEDRWRQGAFLTRARKQKIGLSHSQLRGGITLKDASKDWQDALHLHSDLTQKVISEQTKCSQTFDYVRLYLFVQVYFLQQEKTDEHLAHLRRERTKWSLVASSLEAGDGPLKIRVGNWGKRSQRL